MSKSKLIKLVTSKIFMIIVLITLSVISITVGVTDIDYMNITDHDMLVLLTVRVPRLISILVVGASVSITGLIMQTITKNKFVSPTTTGTTEWCRLGIMVAMLIFSNAKMMHKMTFAFIFALVGSFIFMSLLNRIKIKNVIFIPLVGIMMGNVVSSITTFFAYRYDLVQNMNSWLQGNFALIMKGRFELLYIGIPFLILGFVFANKFTIAGMGKDFSTNLGLNHKKIVTIGLLIVSMITSTVVITVGSIPFLDLIVPNIVSIYKGDNLKNSLLDTALIGTIFILICDIFGRIIIFPFEMTIGVIVSVFGSAIFLISIFRNNRLLA